MTGENAEKILIEELRRIAPDIDVAEIDRQGDLREEFDIDSMDFLNLVTALAKRLGIAMPEADYDAMMSFDAMTSYLARHAG